MPRRLMLLLSCVWGEFGLDASPPSAMLSQSTSKSLLHSPFSSAVLTTEGAGSKSHHSRTDLSPTPPPPVPIPTPGDAGDVGATAGSSRRSSRSRHRAHANAPAHRAHDTRTRNPGARSRSGTTATPPHTPAIFAAMASAVRSLRPPPLTLLISPRRCWRSGWWARKMPVMHGETTSHSGTTELSIAAISSITPVYVYTSHACTLNVCAYTHIQNNSTTPTCKQREKERRETERQRERGGERERERDRENSFYRRAS